MLSRRAIQGGHRRPFSEQRRHEQLAPVSLPQPAKAGRVGRKAECRQHLRRHTFGVRFAMSLMHTCDPGPFPGRFVEKRGATTTWWCRTGQSIPENEIRPWWLKPIPLVHKG